MDKMSSYGRQGGSWRAWDRAASSLFKKMVSRFVNMLVAFSLAGAKKVSKTIHDLPFYRLFVVGFVASKAWSRVLF